MNNILCFFGVHSWDDPDRLGIVECKQCKDISIEKTKIKRHSFTPSKIIGSDIVYLREKGDFEE